MKKDNGEVRKETKALAKIRTRIDRYFEDIGRENFDSIDDLRIECIDDIEYVIDRVEIPTKVLILEKFFSDKEQKGEDDNGDKRN